jgi:hypothetical protein
MATPEQIKAARALLRMEQEELAKTRRRFGHDDPAA